MCVRMYMYKCVCVCTIHHEQDKFTIIFSYSKLVGIFLDFISEEEEKNPNLTQTKWTYFDKIDQHHIYENLGRSPSLTHDVPFK